MNHLIRCQEPLSRPEENRPGNPEIRYPEEAQELNQELEGRGHFEELGTVSLHLNSVRMRYIHGGNFSCKYLEYLVDFHVCGVLLDHL